MGRLYADGGLFRYNHSGDASLAGKRESMATEKQRAAAGKNIKKAAAAAKEKRTIAHLPKAKRSALGKEGAKARAKKS